MKYSDNTQIYHTLQNLSNLESSFLDYSVHARDFSKFKTYFRFMDNYTIRTHDLWMFYFPYPPGSQIPESVAVNENETLGEDSAIRPGMDFSVGKLFNFPDGPMHKCNYYTLIYAMQGSGTLTIEHTAFSLKAGDFYLVPPLVSYALGIDQESIILFLDFRISFIQTEYHTIFMDEQQISTFITGALDGDSSLTHLAIHSDNSSNVQEPVLHIMREYINQEKLCRNAMKHYLCLLFTELYRQNAEITSSQRVSRTVQHYQQIVDYLKQNYQTADLDSAADAIHFSKQYVCRIVRDASGITFNQLLMKIRLDLVRTYLLQSNLSIEKITEICGFSTPSHMSRSFKQEYGVSPSEYKKQEGVR